MKNSFKVANKKIPKLYNAVHDIETHFGDVDLMNSDFNEWIDDLLGFCDNLLIAWNE